MKEHIKPARIKKILKEFQPLDFLILLGQKSNGKSTACKSVAVESAYHDNGLFAYIRRYKNDVSPTKVDSYFTNVKGFSIKNLTGGEFDTMKARAGEIHFKDSKDKTKDKIAGYYFSLATYEEFSSLNYPNVKYFIFEEFVTLRAYLPQEQEKLNILTSTIIRGNHGTVFMIGNTMSTLCPYFRDFELTGIKNQKQDTVDLYQIGDTRVAVFMTAPLEHSESYSMFMGGSADMITKGGFIARTQRKLNYDYEEYKTIYTMVFEYNDNLFLMRLLQHESDSLIWYVTKKTTPVKKNTRLVTNKNIENILHTPDFIPLNNNERIIFDYLKNDFIAFGDNLTGTEFKQALSLLRKEG